MPKISVYHIQDHPSLREPGGLQSFIKDHESVKRFIRMRKSSSRKSTYELELLAQLRNIDRIGENVNKLVDGALGKDLSSLHPEAGKIRQEIAEFNLKFDNVKKLMNTSNA